MIDNLKAMAKSVTSDAFNSILNFGSSVNLIYDAGLPDVKGPKPMTLKFSPGQLEIKYRGFLYFERRIVISANDLLEVEMKVQDVNQTANTIKGAMIGGLLIGGLGAIGMAGQMGKQKREDNLHLVIR